jgi:protein-tyrosine-phosphatase
MMIVIFACGESSGSSQIAAAYFNQFADADRARALSADNHPAPSVDPEVVAAMREVGIDLGSARPRQLTRFLARSADLLVTMGYSETCLLAPGLRREDWRIEDPQGQVPEVVRSIRREIHERVQQLVAREGVTKG